MKITEKDIKDLFKKAKGNQDIKLSKKAAQRLKENLIEKSKEKLEQEYISLIRKAIKITIHRGSKRVKSYDIALVEGL